jgi:hypothetical protein
MDTDGQEEYVNEIKNKTENQVFSFSASPKQSNYLI